MGNEIWLSPLGRIERSLGPHRPKFIRTQRYARYAPANINFPQGKIFELIPPRYASPAFFHAEGGWRTQHF
jgi:hypothetical protein